MIKIIANTVLGIILIFVWSRFVNIGQIIATLSKFNLIYLLPIFAFMLLSPILRAIRLKIFLSEVQKISLKDLIFLNGISQILNYFIPIRAGEIAKGIYLHTQYKMDLKKGVVWIFLDRFVDFLVVLMMAAIFLMIVPTALNTNMVIITVLMFLGGVILTYLAIFNVSIFQKLINFLMPLLIERHIKIYFAKFSHFILDSFKILKRSPKDLFLMIIITVLAYGADAAIWYFSFMALGSNQDFVKMYLGQLLSALTYLIPAAPGYIGSAEASGLLVLSGILKIGTNLASATTVLLHVLSAIFIIIFGLISIFSLKIDLKEIMQKALKRS